MARAGWQSALAVVPQKRVLSAWHGWVPPAHQQPMASGVERTGGQATAARASIRSGPLGALCRSSCCGGHSRLRARMQLKPVWTEEASSPLPAEPSAITPAPSALAPGRRPGPCRGEALPADAEQLRLATCVSCCPCRAPLTHQASQFRACTEGRRRAGVAELVLQAQSLSASRHTPWY